MEDSHENVAYHTQFLWQSLVMTAHGTSIEGVCACGLSNVIETQNVIGEILSNSINTPDIAEKWHQSIQYKNRHQMMLFSPC